MFPLLNKLWSIDWKSTPWESAITKEFVNIWIQKKVLISHMLNPEILKFWILISTEDPKKWKKWLLIILVSTKFSTEMNNSKNGVNNRLWIASISLLKQWENLKLSILVLKRVLILTMIPWIIFNGMKSTVLLLIDLWLNKWFKLLKWRLLIIICPVILRNGLNKFKKILKIY